ncbi:MAG: T9SS type A sorting domain-containing protein, partial [Bacteroidetes bacterium]|nr:T9SS type A sorting domain-containing protein [Bacteroidota bacterium]
FYEHGSNANSTYDTSSGFSNTGNTFSLGDYNSNERALGSLCTGSIDTVIYGAKYKNSTGGNINTLKISYVGEMWKYQGSPDRLEFQYSLDATSVSDYNATWIDANVLDFVSPSGTASTALNGNAPANRTIFNNVAISLNSNVTNGSTFFIRFLDVNSAGSDAAIGVDSFVLDPENIVTTHYYSKSSGDLDNVTNWGVNTDGSGANPANFTTDAQIFHIQNNSSATIGNNWVVSGVGSKVLLGDSATNIMFTIPSSFTMTGNLDVKYLGKLRMQNSTLPSIGAVETGSTIEFNQASAYTIPTTINYYNLILSGAGTKTFSGNTTTVLGDLTFNNLTVDYPGASPFSTINLTGNMTYIGTVNNADTARSTSITTVGNGDQLINSAGNNFYIFNVISTKTAGSLRLAPNTPMRVRGDLRLSMSSNARFSDSSNVIQISDDFQTDGADTNYSLTGTIVMRANTATGNVEQAAAGGAAKAQLNNLIWNLSGSAVGNFSGTNSSITIKGDMTITNSNSGAINLSSNQYHLKGNYINNRTTDVITEATSKVYFDGSSAQTISGVYSGGEIFNQLILDNSNNVSANTPLYINDTLNLMNGHVTTSNHVIVNTAGAIIRTNGWVNGTIQKYIPTGGSVTKSFELGDASNYLPVSLTFTNVTNAGFAAMRSNQSNIPGSAYSRVCIDTNKTIDRAWTVASNGGLDFDTYNATITYIGTDSTSGGGASQNSVIYADNGVNIEKGNVSSRTSSSFTFMGDTLAGTILVGEQMVITSTFTKSNNTPCLGTNVVLTYTGSGNSTMNYAWSLSGATVLSGTGSGPYTVNWGSTGEKPLSLIVSGLGCTTSSTYDTLTVFENGWIGIIDTMWSRAANWCSGSVPTATSNIVIPAGVTNFPTVHTSASCRNITIASGASLKIVNGGNLNVKGLYRRNGSFTHLGGYLTLDSANIIPSDSYFALVLKSASPATYTLSGNISVANVFQLIGSNSNNLNTNGYNANLYGDVTINSQVSGTGNLNFLRASGYQTLSGVSGVTTISNAVFNNAASGGTRLYNSAQINKVTLTQGTLVINPAVTLTIGTSGCSTCDLITTGGSILGGGSTTTSLLVINGNGSAPKITNLKLTTPGSFTVNRTNGVDMGSAMTVGNELTLSNGTLNMNGYNLSLGNISTALGILTTTSGKIINNNSSGTFTIAGNSSAPTITNLVLDTMYNFTLNRPNGAVLASDFNLKGFAALQKGDVDLNGRIISLGSTGSISEQAGQNFKGDSGYIIATRNLSTSVTNLNMSGLGLKLTTAAATGNTSIVRGHTISTHNSSSSAKRHFRVKVANATNASVFEFQYDSTELNGATRTNLKLYKTNDSGATWSNYNCTASTANTATGYVSKTNIPLMTSFVLYTISDSVSNALSPVFVTGASAVTSNNVRTSNDNKIAVYPNPFNSDLNILLNVEKGNYNIALFDMSGKVVTNNVVETSGQSTPVVLSLGHVSSGVYFVRVSNNSETYTLKVVKE